jgi:hypothetical protein
MGCGSLGSYRCIVSEAPASNGHPVATQSGGVRSGEAEAGPSRSVLGGESGIDDKNGGWVTSEARRRFASTIKGK